mmetsp:Transcript_1216/g.3854  ORF Transcript_1216/g.3854 Transcript_1216/m.3854 type:complete len:289 (-) Transcript_1216:357-1223(-)
MVSSGTMRRLLVMSSDSLRACRTETTEGFRGGLLTCPMCLVRCFLDFAPCCAPCGATRCCSSVSAFTLAGMSKSARIQHKLKLSTKTSTSVSNTESNADKGTLSITIVARHGADAMEAAKYTLLNGVDAGAMACASCAISCLINCRFRPARCFEASIRSALRMCNTKTKHQDVVPTILSTSSTSSLNTTCNGLFHTRTRTTSSNVGASPTFAASARAGAASSTSDSRVSPPFGKFFPNPLNTRCSSRIALEPSLARNASTAKTFMPPNNASVPPPDFFAVTRTAGANA